MPYSYSKVNSENARLLQALIDDAPSYTEDTGSRNAEILKSIINETEYTEEPQSEIEELLLELKQKISGGIVAEPLSVTENGIYTAEEGKAFTPVTVEVPLPQNAYLLKSATPSDIVTFNDGADAPLNSLKVSIEPVQDLHGYDKPWPPNATVNKLPNSLSATKELNGIKAVSDGFGGYTITGTATADTIITFDLVTSYVIPNSGTQGGNGVFYVGNDIANNNFGILLYNNNTQIDSWVCNTVNRTTASYGSMAGKTMNKVGFKVISGTSGPIHFNPMFTENGSTSENFIPYSNICPIEGWTEANIHANTDTITVSFGQTVYEGSLDVGRGIITVTDGNIASYNGESLPSTWISSMDEYAEGATPTTGAQVVYKLATPTTIQLTPTQVRSLSGLNNIYADCGNITECEYFSKEE